MTLSRLVIDNVRNIAHAELRLSPRLNVVVGRNGSGKSSLLESIYLLGTSRSMRTANVRQIIRHNQAALTVFAELDGRDGVGPIRVGVEKTTTETRLRMDGQSIPNIAEIARRIPVQYYGPETQALLDGGPRYRRRQLDWGVFHVEHGYLDAWRRFTRLLKQRNAALRDRRMRSTIGLWDDELAQSAAAVTAHRKTYLARFVPEFASHFESLVQEPIDLEVTFRAGWPAAIDFQQALTEYREKDSVAGFTQYGPQRADLELSVGGRPARDVLSRGQKKLLSIAFCLAQVQVLNQRTQRSCALLIDDLPSELDLEHRTSVLGRLMEQSNQLFLTAIESGQLPVAPADDGGHRLFHVEHGHITEVV